MSQLLSYLASRAPILQSLGFRADAFDTLSKYLNWLWQSNQELNLVSRKMTVEELVDNHVIDCLLPIAHFPRNAKAVGDFGSGGGLPGVLYAIQFPQIEFQLFEKSPLKCQFLESCKVLAPNLKVMGDIPAKILGLDCVVARGFKPVDVILDMSREYYNSGGAYFLLKGRREKIDEEFVDAHKKFKNLKDRQVTIESLQSPVLDVERHLVQIR